MSGMTGAKRWRANERIPPIRQPDREPVAHKPETNAAARQCVGCQAARAGAGPARKPAAQHHQVGAGIIAGIEAEADAEKKTMSAWKHEGAWNRCAAEKERDYAFYAEWLSYDKDTGIFTWKKRSSSRAGKGSVAGHIKSGRLVITLKQCVVKASRLAWLFIHKEWPRNEIDHINRDPLDNRIANLRVVNRSENCMNRGATKRKLYNGLPMPPGLTIRPERYVACVYTAKQRHFLGAFDSSNDAFDCLITEGKKIKGDLWAEELLDEYGHML